ncbi:hypothetical protein VNO80_19824 [Phaseolus coccineus]|uniref:Glutaredoxin domain-containing protein n=1 Tax=Phaseolus coccineus TaxID=3886 RepID=A0AAN9R131_PHACN
MMSRHLHGQQRLKLLSIDAGCAEKSLALFGCLCYAFNILFQELGVKPLVHEIDHDPDGREMQKALLRLGCNSPVPAVFIGGKLIGSAYVIHSLHC